MRLLLAVLLCWGVPARAADQFDLACQGTRMTERDGPAQPHSFRVRVDLTGHRWCAGDCARVQPVVRVEGDKIVLTDDLILNTREETLRETSIDRKSNAFHYVLSQVRPEEAYEKIDAQCAEAAFSGFPGQGG